jgi:hypothetical protein
VGSSNGATLAERWNGTTWTIQPTPDTSGSSLNGVACTSANACTAVGSSNGATLAERWNGTIWTVQTTPIPDTGPALGGGGSLTGVSCTSATACIAVGWEDICDFTCGCCGLALAERWDGTTWTIQDTIDSTPAIIYSTFSAVSCSAATACTAVGSAPANVGGTLAERWDGNRWTVQTSPTSSGVGALVNLSGVTCTSATACSAVGNYAERWDGNTWTVQTTPNDGSVNGVSCTSATECIAVGSSDGMTLAERYSG